MMENPCGKPGGETHRRRYKEATISIPGGGLFFFFEKYIPALDLAKKYPDLNHV